jgi:hypothetical protein
VYLLFPGLEGESVMYNQENEAKATFDKVYVQPTPHAYVQNMALHGYQIGEQARPYCLEATQLLNELNSNAWPVQMLDLGCSYGMASAFLKYGCSFDEIVAFFGSRAPKELIACAEVTRMWLNVAPPACDIRCVGLDSSEPAVSFALRAGLLDGGIAKNYEDKTVQPSKEDIEWFRSCNMLVSTGAIGYVTEESLRKILPHLGKDHPTKYGPFAVVTILRMFEIDTVRECFGEAGLTLTQVPDIRLAQRNFADDNERDGVISLLHEQGVDTTGYEDTGTLYADLYVAAAEDHIDRLVSLMQKVETQIDKDSNVGYIQR